MPNRKLLPQALSLACIALSWATTASAASSTAATDDGNLPMLAVAGTVLLLVAALVWRALASRRAKKPDTSAFMTLEQITRLEFPGDGSTLMKVAQPKPIPTLMQENTVGKKQPISQPEAYMSDLEKEYPRIVEKLVAMWPDPDCGTYLQNLTFDERGDRAGFSREIAAEIMLLHSLKVKPHSGVWH